MIVMGTEMIHKLYTDFGFLLPTRIYDNFNYFQYLSLIIIR